LAVAILVLDVLEVEEVVMDPQDQQVPQVEAQEQLVLKA
jgi:hypothetical protein